MKRKAWFNWGIIIIITLLSAVPAGSVPNRISYQGVLKDSNGDPVAGPVNMTFSLHDREDEQKALWSEDHTGVVLDNGVYNVMLGGGTTTIGFFNENLFSGDNLWLEVTVNGEVLTPRISLASSAFGFKAADADTVGGHDASSFATSGHNHGAQYYTQAEVDNLINNITSAYENRISGLEAKLAHVSVVGDTLIFSDINVRINTSAGNLDIKAKTVDIESLGNMNINAKGNATISSMGTKIEGKGMLDLKGPITKISGSAMVEVKGGIIKLN